MHHTAAGILGDISAHKVHFNRFTTQFSMRFLSVPTLRHGFPANNHPSSRSRGYHVQLVRPMAAGKPFDRDLSPEEAWEALSLSKRELQLAVSEEDYKLAAQLRDKVLQLTEALPSRKRLLLSMLEQLKGNDLQEKAGALRVIGELGDTDALPQLSLCLADLQLQQLTEATMWKIFGHSSNPRVEMLMREGCSMMGRPGDWADCLRTFSSVVEEDPHFAEGYNKRATLLYLLKRYQESVADCLTVLELNPYHFGAASGLGMCYSQMGEYEGAIQAFQRALAIHPGLAELRGNIEQLKDFMREQQ